MTQPSKPWAIVWSAPAADDMRKLDRQVAQRIHTTLHRYAAAEHGDVKRLQGIDPPEWRLRVGDWRVRFTYDHAAKALHILHVFHRSSAYHD